MSLFNCYDGPGPVRRFPMTERVLTPVNRAIVHDALRARGLYTSYTASVPNPQAVALRMVPGVRWKE